MLAEEAVKTQARLETFRHSTVRGAHEPEPLSERVASHVAVNGRYSRSFGRRRPNSLAAHDQFGLGITRSLCNLRKKKEIKLSQGGSGVAPDIFRY